MKKGSKRKNLTVQERLLTEAASNLERKRQFQTTVTKEHTLEEILSIKDVQYSGTDEKGKVDLETLPEVSEGVVAVEGLPVEQPKPRTRRVRQKMRSSPVVGGGLFEDSTLGTQRTGADVSKSVHKRQELVDSKDGELASTAVEDVESQLTGTSCPAPSTSEVNQPKPRPRTRRKMLSVPVRGAGGLFGVPEPSDEDQRAAFEDFRRQHEKKRDQFFAKQGPSGIPAEMHVEGEIFKIRISQETLDNLRKGATGQMVNGSVFGVTMASEDAPVVNMLHGYVRAPPQLGKITEEAISEAPSEMSEDGCSAEHKNGDIH